MPHCKSRRANREHCEHWNFFSPRGKNSALVSLTKLGGAIAERFRDDAPLTLTPNRKEASHGKEGDEAAHRQGGVSGRTQGSIDAMTRAYRRDDGRG